MHYQAQPLPVVHRRCRFHLRQAGMPRGRTQCTSPAPSKEKLDRRKDSDRLERNCYSIGVTAKGARLALFVGQSERHDENRRNTDAGADRPGLPGMRQRCCPGNSPGTVKCDIHYRADGRCIHFSGNSPLDFEKRRHYIPEPSLDGLCAVGKSLIIITCERGTLLSPDKSCIAEVIQSVTFSQPKRVRL